VRGANDAEVPPVKCGDFGDLESLRGRDDGRVDCSKREVFILSHELRDPDPLTRLDGLGDEVSRREVPQEPHFGFRAQSSPQQVHDFGHHKLRNDQGTGVRFEDRQARFMVSVIFVDVGIERPRIDDERYRRASLRRISSIRRAV
jgi:hypothetical protein